MIKFNQAILRQLRLRKDITQDKVARALGYNATSAYSKIERGEQDITAEQLAVLANLYGIKDMNVFFYIPISQNEKVIT